MRDRLALPSPTDAQVDVKTASGSDSDSDSLTDSASSVTTGDASPYTSPIALPSQWTGPVTTDGLGTPIDTHFVSPSDDFNLGPPGDSHSGHDELSWTSGDEPDALVALLSSPPGSPVSGCSSVTDALSIAEGIECHPLLPASVAEWDEFHSVQSSPLKRARSVSLSDELDDHPPKRAHLAGHLADDNQPEWNFDHEDPFLSSEFPPLFLSELAQPYSPSQSH